MIDPKGVVGPEIFDLPRFIMNELDSKLNHSGKVHIEQVIYALSKSLHYPSADIGKLFFMEVILANVWCVEDEEEIALCDIDIAMEVFDDSSVW